MNARKWFRYMIFGWLLAATVEYFLLPGDARDLSGLNGLCQMSLPRLAAVALGGGLLIFATDLLGVPEKIQRLFPLLCTAALVTAALAASFTWAFLSACAIVLTLAAVYAVFGWDSRPENAAREAPANRLGIFVTVVLSALFFLFVCGWTVGRYDCFSTPTYDFGIFSQMFYYMKETGLPMTTLERDGLLSHFAVHVSPIYYCMLPFYCLAPSPATLQVLQAAVLTSSVIPLRKLGKRHGLADWEIIVITAILLLYPALSGGTGYDIHENCFLTPLLLWLFYGIDSKKSGITAAAAVLCLGVKEDAAVYVAVIALWLIAKTVLREDAKRQDWITGSLLLVGSLAWFLLVTGYLAKSGDGVMTYRYNNFMYDGSSSLLTVIKASIMSPMKVLYECADGEKLEFIILTMLPLLGTPLFTRRYERYILLIPYLLVNLMSDYRYQHDIFFQYAFGSTACLMYLTVVNLADLKSFRILPLIGAAVISVMCFGMVVVPKAIPYPVRCIQYYSHYSATRNVLNQIPEDAPVAATTFYTSYLSQRKILYDVRYSSREHILETEYIVLNISAENDYQRYADEGLENGRENFIRFLTENGYTPYLEAEGNLVIYWKIPTP